MKACINCREAVEVSIVKLHGGPICPKCGNEIMQADEFYLEAIEELNEKGYYVDAFDFQSISSVDKTSTIVFNECVDSFPSIPNDCYLIIIGDIDEQQITLNYTFVDCETELSILRNAINVYLWTLELPAVGTDEYFDALTTCYINNMGDDPE